jgi:hypothetical protein
MSLNLENVYLKTFFKHELYVSRQDKFIKIVSKFSNLKPGRSNSYYIQEAAKLLYIRCKWENNFSKVQPSFEVIEQR